MLAKFFMESPNSSKADKEKLAPRLRERAERAYEYAKAMFERNGPKSTCSRSLALNNCIGSNCRTGSLSVRSYDCHHRPQAPGKALTDVCSHNAA
jgi:hypothetical protein